MLLGGIEIELSDIEKKREGKLLRVLKREDNIPQAAEKIFGKSTKKSRKLFIQLINERKFNLLFLVYNLKEVLNPDLNKLFSICTDSVLDLGSFYSKDLKRSQFKLLGKKFKRDKILSWIIKRQDYTPRYYFFSEVLNQLDRLKDCSFIGNLEKYNPQCLISLHNALSKIEGMLDYENFNLNQKAEVLKFDSLCFEGSSIFVPKSKYDLLSVGDDFDFCIGTDNRYGERIKNGECSFFAIYRNKKPIAGVFFDEQRIIELYSFKNRNLNYEMREKIRMFLYGNKNEICMNKDSTFAQKITYNKETEKLTIVTKNGTIISYSGVDGETIDLFENAHSAGRFYAQNIKGKFPYEGSLKAS